jgi:hypothetical protein
LHSIWPYDRLHISSLDIRGGREIPIFYKGFLGLIFVECRTIFLKGGLAKKSPILFRIGAMVSALRAGGYLSNSLCQKERIYGLMEQERILFLKV